VTNRLSFLWAAVVAFGTLALAPVAARAEATPRQMVQMLDYLGRDYPGAVQDGKVVSEFEYEEQKEFAKIVMEAAQAHPALAGARGIIADVEKLQKNIDDKADGSVIAALTGDLRGRVIQATKLSVAPTEWPNIARGKAIYAQQCAGCHGATGAGDGPQGEGMEPAPANFTDRELMTSLTPFQAFNTTRNGVQGTGMPPFSDLSDAEAWDVSFALFALRHPQAPTAVPSDVLNQALPSLHALATLNDTEITRKLEGEPGKIAGLVDALRADPAKVINSQTRLQVARGNLADALVAYQTEQFAEAESHALLAYLDGIEPFEARLSARDSAIVPRIEQAMLAVRSAISSKRSEAEVKEAIENAYAVLADAEKVLSATSMSYAMTFVASLLIMLREGFEAVLIVVALLAVLRRFDAPRARRWTHIGWISALLMGAATWVLSETLLTISGAQREVLEGVVALIAVAVLIYMGFWLHNQGEIRKWTAFVNTKARQAVAEKRYYTFFGLSFLAVYREVFETVLFYRALALDTTSSTQSALLVGFGVGVVGIAIMAYAMLKIGARVPIRRFFQASAAIIFALTVVLLGKGLSALQEAGWIDVTSFPVNLRVDVLGIFPTYETLIPQVVLIVILLVARWRLDLAARTPKGGAPAPSR
jgi:high-affinity iron transporter